MGPEEAVATRQVLSDLVRFHVKDKHLDSCKDEIMRIVAIGNVEKYQFQLQSEIDELNREIRSLNDQVEALRTARSKLSKEEV